MRLNAPADMVGTGVPLLFRFYFLAEADLTGERPFHTCTQDPWQRRRSPNPHHTNWRRLLFSHSETSGKPTGSDLKHSF